jgi:predicted deacetylase
MSSRRALVVAVHDVAPATLPQTEALLSLLDSMDIRPRVLKVVPEHLKASPALVSLLINEQAAGSEVVMHGYSHRAEGPLRGPLARRLRARISAPGAAEFMTLSPDDVAWRLRKGRDILDSLGVRAEGFCAPGWLEPPGLLQALQAAGFRYDVRMLSVVEVATRRITRTAWIGYMGAGPVQERLVAVANTLTRRLLARAPVLKVFVHPAGTGAEGHWRAVLDLLPRLSHDREVLTYGQLIRH